jgi:CrcB protein
MVLVGVGGAFGSVARYLVTTASLARFGSLFPWGTLAVNVVGSLLLGVLFQLSRSTEALSPSAQLALGTGVMGGFTTYSTFNLETLRYAQDGHYRTAVLYMGATLLCCLAAGFVGVYVVRLLAGK